MWTRSSSSSLRVGATRVDLEGLGKGASGTQPRGSRSWPSSNGSDGNRLTSTPDSRQNSEKVPEWHNGEEGSRRADTERSFDNLSKSLEEQKRAVWGHPDPRVDQAIAVLAPFR